MTSAGVGVNCSEDNLKMVLSLWYCRVQISFPHPGFLAPSLMTATELFLLHVCPKVRNKLPNFRILKYWLGLGDKHGFGKDELCYLPDCSSKFFLARLQTTIICLLSSRIPTRKSNAKLPLKVETECRKI
jgi:hypothetical protein